MPVAANSQENFFPAWKEDISLGVGLEKSQSSQKEHLIHGGYSLFLWPLEGKDNLELKFQLETQSPLEENRGYVAVPLKESEFVNLAEFYLKHQLFEQFSYTIGRYHEEPDPITPYFWPFYSIGSTIGLVHTKFLSLDAIWRQDILSLYSSYENKNKASSLERKFLEIKTKINLFDFKKNQISLEQIDSFEQFYDPDGMLSSLSLGRSSYIQNNVTDHDTEYKVYKIKNNLFYTYEDILKNQIYLYYWNNVASIAVNEGLGYGCGSTFFLGPNTQGSIFYHKYFIGQNSIAPVSLKENLYPGFSIDSLEIQSILPLHSRVQLHTKFLWQNAQTYHQRQDIFHNMTPPIPKIQFLLEAHFQIFGETNNGSRLDKQGN